MKTLIINGSPRLEGGTATLARLLAERLPGTVDIVRTYGGDIAPCTDCRACWHRDGCAIEDGMQGVYRQLDRADNIVLASPIYFAEMTGSMLQWASRLQCIWTARHMRQVHLLAQRPRRGGVLLVDGGEGRFETAHAMGRRLLRLLSAEDCGLVYFSGTDLVNPTLPGHEILAQLDLLARALTAPR